MHFVNAIFMQQNESDSRLKCGKSSELVPYKCAITGSCLRMHQRPSE